MIYSDPYLDLTMAMVAKTGMTVFRLASYAHLQCSTGKLMKNTFSAENCNLLSNYALLKIFLKEQNHQAPLLLNY